MGRVTETAQSFWRYWLMLSRIPRFPARTSTAALESHLAEQGIEIDLRSIQRDLLKLSAYFPIEHDDNKPRGWFFSSTAARFDLPGMDAHAAIAFRLVETYLKSQLPRSTLTALEPHFQTAQHLLKSFKKRGLPSWTDKIYIAPRYQPLLPPQVPDDVMSAVYEALLADKTLLLSYQGRDKKKRSDDVVVHPHGLIFRDAVAYLACTFWDYSDIRLLALHRIEKAQLQETPRQVIPDFSLEAYAKSGVAGWKEGEKPLRFVLRFLPEAASTVLETPLTTEQKTKTLPDGRTQVEAVLPNTRILRAWLRSFGIAVEVVKPLSVRKELAAEAQKMAAQYET